MSSQRSLYNSELASSLAAQSRTLYNTIISYLQSGAAKTFRNVQLTGGSLSALTNIDSTFGSFTSLTLGSRVVQDVYLTLLAYGTSVLSVMTNAIKVSNFKITLESSTISLTGTSKITGGLVLDAEHLKSSSIISASSTTLALQIPMSKIYCDDAMDCTVTLPNGTQDGQMRVIQWLPTMTSPMVDNTNYVFPRLIINGSFCYPQYLTAVEQFFSSQISDQMIILPTTGMSITFVFDTLIMAWVPMHSGGTFTG